MSESRFPWRTLLFVSVALNLLIIGAVAGGWSAGVRLEREGNDRAVVERFPGARAFLQALPPQTRAIMRDELAASWAQSRDTRQAALQARRDAFAAAGREPYDAASVRAAFARLRAADQAAIGVFHDNVVDALGKLTPEQRRAALESLRRSAPASRREGVAPAAEDGAPPALTPERREEIQERRQERCERWRQRREERMRQPPTEPQP